MKKNFQTQTSIDYYEFKKFKKAFPFEFKKTLMITSIIMIFICFTDIMESEVNFEYLFITVLTALCLIGISALIIKLIDCLLLKFRYKKFIKNNMNDMNFDITFYTDYLERKGKNISLKIYYSDIKKIKETIENIYLYVNKENVIIIQKENCEERLIEFINNIKFNANKDISINSLFVVESSKSENKVVPVKKVSQGSSPKKRKKIEIFLIILFIFTIISLWLALMSFTFIGFYFCDLSVFIFQYSWICFLWLPIPILSFILGIIYKRKGIKCTKNIVCGIIIGILMLIYGCIGFMVPDFEKDYQEVYQFNEIVDIELPTEGTYKQVVWDESYLLNHISNYINFTNPKEIQNFNDQISQNSNWITKENINSTLSILATSSASSSASASCDINNTCYYSIYIEEVDSYNILPNESGRYHIYSMVYNINKSKLEIEDYYYDYVK